MLVISPNDGIFKADGTTYKIGPFADSPKADEYFQYIPTIDPDASQSLADRAKPINLHHLVDQAIFIYKQFISEKEKECDKATEAFQGSSWRGNLYTLSGYVAGLAEFVTLMAVMYTALPALGLISIAGCIAGALAGAWAIYKYFEWYAQKHHDAAEQNGKLMHKYQIQLNGLEQMMQELLINPDFANYMAEKYPAQEDYLENVDKLTQDLTYELTNHLELLASQAIPV